MPYSSFESFITGAACATFFFAAYYLIDKINELDDDIQELFSRLESSQDRELKK